MEETPQRPGCNPLSFMAALRITTGKPPLARWIGEGKAQLAKCKVPARTTVFSSIIVRSGGLAPLLAAAALSQFDSGGPQRRFA